MEENSDSAPGPQSATHDPQGRSDSAIDRPAIWAVVLNWRDHEATAECVDALLGSGYANLTVLIVDNGSGDESEELLRTRFSNCEFLQTGENLGYAGGNAAGILYAVERGAYAVLVINPDCIAEPGFLDPLVEELEFHPDTGATGPVQLNYENGKLIWANGGSRFSTWSGRVSPDGPSGFEDPPREGRFEVGFICGACILLRAEAIREVGPFDPRLFLFSEEPDWCLRAADRGWKSITVANSRVTHKGSAATDRVRCASLFYICRNSVWVARRHGSFASALANMLGALFIRMPRAAIANALRGTFDRSVATARGYLAGVFADCRRGSSPGEAAAERVYEVAAEAAATPRAHNGGPMPVDRSAG